MYDSIVASFELLFIGRESCVDRVILARGGALLIDEIRFVISRSTVQTGYTAARARVERNKLFFSCRGGEADGSGC